MPITLPEGLPAARRLRAEGVAVVDAPGGAGTRGRGLRVLLVNLMPRKAVTELQFARLLGRTAHHVDLTLAVPDGYRPRTAPEAHIDAFYARWSAVRDRQFDGLIVTGAPVETLPFEEVSYWQGLRDILDWSETAAGRTVLVCWAAQAALHHRHGIAKRLLEEKRFGVFRQRVLEPRAAAMRGLPVCFDVPVSRHSEVRYADVMRVPGLTALATSARSGLSIVEDAPRRTLCIFDHLEYDATTLRDEFIRDCAARVAVPLPHAYFPEDDPDREPVNTWRPVAERLWRNVLDGMAADRDRPAATRAGRHASCYATARRVA